MLYKNNSFQEQEPYLITQVVLFTVSFCQNSVSLLRQDLSIRSRSRKEVFQPHLPVRLPCYDLAPVTSFTLGRSFYGHALQALPASMA